MWGLLGPEARASRRARLSTGRPPIPAAWMARGVTPSRRRGATRGQAIVEFALFFPVILFLVLGSTDVATLLDDHLDIVYAARAAARVGSILGTAPASDCAIIGTIRAALSSNRNLQPQRIVIYHANADGTPIGTDEDVYQGSAVCNPDTTITPVAISTGWPPGLRSTTPLFEDSIGVEIDYAYTFQLDLLGMGQFTSADHAVMPLEVVIGTPIPPSGVGA